MDIKPLNECANRTFTSPSVQSSIIHEPKPNHLGNRTALHSLTAFYDEGTRSTYKCVRISNSELNFLDSLQSC